MSWEALRQKALLETKKAVADSVNEDNLISQAISGIDDLDKSANLLIRRLRDWFELYSPEFSRSIPDNETFARRILEKSKEEQLQELGVGVSMGASLAKKDVSQIMHLAQTITVLFEQRERLEKYITSLLETYAPNLLVLAGPTISARLLREAGSLKRLAFIQASTIQLYGAEKALFRHLKSGARPPKHGHIIHHPLLIKAPAKNKGKVARALADKISICCKVDFFKGEPIGQKLKKELEEKFL